MAEKELRAACIAGRIVAKALATPAAQKGGAILLTVDDECKEMLDLELRDAVRKQMRENGWGLSRFMVAVTPPKEEKPR